LFRKYAVKLYFQFINTIINTYIPRKNKNVFPGLCRLPTEDSLGIYLLSYTLLCHYDCWCFMVCQCRHVRSYK